MSDNPSASTWPLIDPHRDRIKDWLDADVAVATIAQRLGDDHTVGAAESSVRRWIATHFAEEVVRERVAVPRGEVPRVSEAPIDSAGRASPRRGTPPTPTGTTSSYIRTPSTPTPPTTPSGSSLDTSCRWAGRNRAAGSARVGAAGTQRLDAKRFRWSFVIRPTWRGQSQPLGLSITYSQLPSGWRRTTSAYLPLVSMSFPSASRPVSVQFPMTSAVSPERRVFSALT